MPPSLQILFAAILGLAFGSFGTMLLSRLPKGKSFMGRSRCPHCSSIIRPVDLVPVVSFLLLRGKCRSCEKPIPWRYPYLEALTALVFALLLLTFHRQPLLLLLSGVASYLLVLIAFYDAASQRIPDAFVALLFLAALGASSLRGLSDPLAFRDAFIGAAIPFVFFGFLFVAGNVWNQVRAKGLVQPLFPREWNPQQRSADLVTATMERGAGWIGSGDILLGTSIGLLLGTMGTITALLLAYILGAVIATFLILMGAVAESRTIAFAPFLALGSLLVLFFGDALLKKYMVLL